MDKKELSFILNLVIPYIDKRKTLSKKEIIAFINSETDNSLDLTKADEKRIIKALLKQKVMISLGKDRFKASKKSLKKAFIDFFRDVEKNMKEYGYGESLPAKKKASDQ